MDECSVNEALVAAALSICKDDAQEWMVRTMATPEGLEVRWDDEFWTEARWDYFYETRRRLAVRGIRTIERGPWNGPRNTYHLHPEPVSDLDRALWAVGWEDTWVEWPGEEDGEVPVDGPVGSVPGVTFDVILLAADILDDLTNFTDALDEEELICISLKAAMEHCANGST